MSENQCDDCEHSCSYFVKVGDCAYGNDVEDWCCAKDDELTELGWDGDGPCPCHEKRTEKEDDYDGDDL